MTIFGIKVYCIVFAVVSIFLILAFFFFVKKVFKLHEEEWEESINNIGDSDDK